MRARRIALAVSLAVAGLAGPALAQTSPDFAVTYDAKFSPTVIAPILGAAVATVLIVGLGWKLGFRLAKKVYGMITGGR